MLQVIKKKDRLNFLQETINNLSKDRSKSIIGKKVEILVESVSSKYSNMINGRTTNNKIITVPGDKDLVGKLINVQVTELNNKTLKGEILEL